MEGSLSVVKMDPSAKEIFQAIKDGRSITGVGTQLESTHPSEANTKVLVLDTGNATAGANETENILSQAGFDVSPGIVTGNAPKGVEHPVIAYLPGQEDYAKVVSAYFPDLKMVQVKGLAAPVVIVVPAGYHPTVPGSSSPGGSGQGGAPAPAQCPTPTG
jgi:hypothetical protein